MPMKPAKMERLVLKQGFLLVDGGKGSHRRYRHPDGRITEINFHAREIRPGTQAAILKQIGLEAPM